MVLRHQCGTTDDQILSRAFFLKVHVMSLTFVMIPSYNSQVCGSVPRREAGSLARS